MFDIGIDAAGAGEELTMRIFTGTDVSIAYLNAIPVTNGTANFDTDRALSVPSAGSSIILRA